MCGLSAGVCTCAHSSIDWTSVRTSIHACVCVCIGQVWHAHPCVCIGNDPALTLCQVERIDRAGSHSPSLHSLVVETDGMANKRLTSGWQADVSRGGVVAAIWTRPFRRWDLTSDWKGSHSTGAWENTSSAWNSKCCWSTWGHLVCH